MGGCQAELVSAVDAAEVVDSVLDDVVSGLNGNGVEEHAARTGTGPEVDEGEIDENSRPDFNGENGTPEISLDGDRGETVWWDQGLGFEHVGWSWHRQFKMHRAMGLTLDVQMLAVEQVHLPSSSQTKSQEVVEVGVSGEGGSIDFGWTQI
jgi:hypothetical protein